MEKKASQLSIGVDDPVSWQQALILGLQHVLAMDVYVPPSMEKKIMIAAVMAAKKRF